MPAQTSLRVKFTCWSFVPLLLVVAAAAAPYCLSRGYLAGWFSLQRGFALVCHQDPERSFWIFGAPLAICARCLGIYFGAAIGLLLQASRRIALQFLVIAAALNLLDWLAELLDLHGNWMLMRFVLGFALGAAGALLISSAIDRRGKPMVRDCRLNTAN